MKIYTLILISLVVSANAWGFQTVNGQRAKEIIRALYDAGNTMEVFPTGVSEIKLTELFCTEAPKTENAQGAARYSCRFGRGKNDETRTAIKTISGVEAEQLFQALSGSGLESKSSGGIVRQSSLVICHDFPGASEIHFPVCAIAPLPAD